jgi:hypothetical protein
VDAYSALEEGRLGQTFSVIKMKSASGGKFGEYYRAGEGYDEDMQFEESDQVSVVFEIISFTLISVPRSSQ